MNSKQKKLGFSQPNTFISLSGLGHVWFNNFHNSISVIHHSSLITQNTLSVWHHHSLVITQYFSHCLWVPYLSVGAVFFFFFFLFSITKPSEKKKPRSDHKTQWKKKKKKKIRSPNPVKEEEEGKKKKTQIRRKKKKPPSVKGKRKKRRWRNATQWRKKKERDGQKLQLKSDSGFLHVMLFSKMSLSYELWKLSYGGAKQTSSYGSHHF